MTRIVTRYKDYLERKAACEDVVPWAHAFASRIMSDIKGEGAFAALLPRESDVDCYHYEVSSNGQVTLVDWSVDIPSGLTNALRLSLCSDPRVSCWWNSVFFEEESTINYDAFYDSFRVCEDSDSQDTFGRLLETIRNEWISLNLDAVRIVFVPEVFFQHKPFRYLLNNEFNTAVIPIPDIAKTTKRQVCLCFGKNIEIRVLAAAGGIQLDSIMSRPISVLVPRVDETLGAFALPGITWRNVTDGLKTSFLRGGTEYVDARLSAERDIFGNLFLNVFDVDDKIKCLKVL